MYEKKRFLIYCFSLLKLLNKARELNENKSNIMKTNKTLTEQIAIVSEKRDLCEAQYKKMLTKRNLFKKKQTAKLLVEQKRYGQLSKEVALVAHFPFTFSLSNIQPTAAEAAPVSGCPAESH